MDIWEKRFRWLWGNCTDGFNTPNGWWMLNGEEPTEEDLKSIDEFIQRNYEAPTPDSES